ncbi:MAG: hypothetical protein V5A55_00855 [Halovenus sp.]
MTVPTTGRAKAVASTEGTVAVRAGELGTTSVPLHYAIRTGNGLAATGEILMTTYDRDEGEPRPIPEAWRDAIEAYETQ